ncbi:phosphatase PAP2 family protein [Candidatus Woesearchaeota archaeon]|nr:phosphatase PAP2 family protein [Candidatus Woesearchaeota archaeon]
MKQKKSIIIAAAFSVLLAASFYLDNQVLSFLQDNNIGAINPIMSWLTNFLTLFFILYLVPSLFSFREKKYNYISYLLLAFIFSAIASVTLKLLIARPRPLDFEVLYRLVQYSFPSLHAAAAFAALPILDTEFRKIKLFWISFAALIGISRIYFGFHYLSDVVAGAVLGYAIGLLFVKLEQKYKIFRNVYKK